MFDQAIAEVQTAVNVQYGPVNPNHIKIIRGSTDILLIAPHACIRDGEPKDDENTGPITELVARQIGCSAIINTHYHKPNKKKYRKGYKPKSDEYPYGFEYGNLNLNVIADAEQIPGYLGAIRSVVDAPGKTTVIWIHGADDKKAKARAKKFKYPFPTDEIHAFIGYGQGDEPITKAEGSRETANLATVERFRDALISNGMNAVRTDDNADNYRGRSEAGMNQWFRNQEYPLEKVESIQLEIRKGGFRDLHHNIEKTAGILIEALSQDILFPDIQDETEADEYLVDLAYNHLRGIFAKHINQAMLQAGQYLVRTFFGTYEKARKWKKIREQSFNRLEERLNNGAGDAPKKTWIYDAVRVAVDDHFFRLEGGQIFRAYGKLGHSHKVRLAYVRQPEIKNKLIEEVADQVERKRPVSDKKLRKRIAEEKAKLPKKKRIPSIFQAIKDIDKLAMKELKEARSFSGINSLGNDEIDRLLNSSVEIVGRVESKVNKLEEEIKAYKSELSIHRQFNGRIKQANEWHEKLRKRESGEETVEYPEETPRLKKLRDAVQFMCFWKGYNYDDFVAETVFGYIPFEEASESRLQYLLRKGKCDLKATYNFDVTKSRKVKWLSPQQVENRVKKGTFWLSEEKYRQLNQYDYQDYDEK